jgi:hypothetical protein
MISQYTQIIHYDYIKYIKDHEDERLLYTVKHYKICYFVPAALVPLSNYKGGVPVLARSSSLRVHAWALSSNHSAEQFILIRCKHSQRAARSFVRGLEIRLNTRPRH